MAESIVMRRILKLEAKNRVKTNPYIEKELLETMVKEGYDISNTMNIALEKHLMQKGVNIRVSGGAT
ncbi:hypothetical protein V7O66_03410 [Methanolobus sp. ZRKC3]|uniref:hypothetical protein n=1 Tax=Methanolobus sp. ZRKC3 TaxID=3125786 RepID=UPI00324B38F1